MCYLENLKVCIEAIAMHAPMSTCTHTHMHAYMHVYRAVYYMDCGSDTCVCHELRW